MEKLFKTIKEYCIEAGVSEYSIRMQIFHETETGIVSSGALLRLGGRWYVDPDKMVEYMRDSAQRWAANQPGPGPRRKKIQPPRRANVGA